ncbi:MAG: hypothetical protein HMLKMBBP_03905 [Planctomycetes bacterium]|nr:hypothetical protein [Planctomycetota bacterium]
MRRPMSPRRSSAAGAAVLLALCALLPCGSAPCAADEPSREKPVIVIGYDGLDAARTERLMAEDRLPNLAKLRARGGYARLATSNPAQSPVSWAVITTGWNTGKNGIPDFLRRKGFDPTRIDFGHAERVESPLFGPWMKVAIVGALGAIGAALGLGIAFAFRARGSAWGRGKKLELLLSAGAALGALVAVVVLRSLPETIVRAENRRSGEPFWTTLDRAGKRCIVLEAPLSFPADAMSCGCCMSGLGVPDMSGMWGSYTLWTDDPMVPGSTETGGAVCFVGRDAPRFDLVIAGPPHPRLPAERRAAIERAAQVEKERRQLSLEWTRAQRRQSETRERLTSLGASLTASLPVALRRGEGATVTLQDGTGVELRPGAWSDLLPVRFEASRLVTLRGRVRLFLESAGSADGRTPFRLLVAQVQFDAAHVPPNVGLSSPPSFAKELESAVGPFETIGWPELTNPVKDRLLSDRAFLDHTYAVMKLRERKLMDRLRRKDFDLLFTMFSEPDRVQHAFYRHVDPKSPTHVPAEAAVFAGEIDRIYEESDRIVGEVVAAAGDGATVIVVSDHGFSSFRRGVNLNLFLRAKGWQTATAPDVERGVAEISGERFFSNVDWTRTQAYGWGLGHISLNVKGREPDGTVDRADMDRVLDGISKDLLALRDADGSPVVRRVFKAKDIYRGPRMDDAGDLVVGFHEGYRVSWQSTIGGGDAGILTDNTQPWSGDHCSVDPDLVPGVLFSSVPLAPSAAPRVEDVAPSILALFRLSVTDPDGVNVLAK